MNWFMGNRIKKYSAFLLIILCNGCTGLNTTEPSRYTVLTDPESRLVFRRVVAQKAGSGLMISGRVEPRSLRPSFHNRLTVTLTQTNGAEIVQKQASYFPRFRSGRTQRPESHFTVRFAEIPAEPFVVHLTSTN